MTKIVKNENAAVVKVIRDYDGRPLEHTDGLSWLIIDQFYPAAF